MSLKKNALLIKKMCKVTWAKKINFRKYSLSCRIFYFMEKLGSFLEIFNVLYLFCIFNHSINCKFSDAMTSICTWERVHFVKYILYHNSLGHETRSTSMVMGNIFRKCFEWLVELGPNSRPFSIYQLEKQFLNNQVWSFFGFSLFWRCGISRLNKVNINY